jgi:hypothetical protein
VFEHNDYNQFFEFDGVKEGVRAKLIVKLSPIFETRYVYVPVNDESKDLNQNFKCACDAVNCLYGFLIKSGNRKSRTVADIQFYKVFEECVEMFGDTKPARP